MGLESEGMNRALEARWMTLVPSRSARYVRALWRPHLERAEARALVATVQRHYAVPQGYYGA